MKLAITLATSNRALGKRYRGIFSEFSKMRKEFADISLANPLYDTVLLMLIDGASKTKILEVKDGDLTVTGGADSLDESDLRNIIWKHIKETISIIGFSKPDLLTVMKLMEKFYDDRPL